MPIRSETWEPTRTAKPATRGQTTTAEPGGVTGDLVGHVSACLWGMDMKSADGGHEMSGRHSCIKQLPTELVHLLVQKPCSSLRNARFLRFARCLRKPSFQFEGHDTDALRLNATVPFHADVPVCQLRLAIGSRGSHPLAALVGDAVYDLRGWGTTI